MSKLLFSKVVTFHIKLMGMERGAPCKHIFCSYTHLRPLGSGQMVNIFFFTESSNVAFQIKGNGTYSTL